MRLFFVFNLIFVPVLVLALAGSGYIVRESLQRNAEQEVLQNARVMMETTTATRSYTTKQIAPLLEHERFKFDRLSSELQQTLDRHLPAAFQQVTDRVPDPAQKKAVAAAQKQVIETLKLRPHDLPEAEFHPQTVPAYAATEIFNYFRAQYPDYAYKEATLNPTNPRDRTADWEADVVNEFRQKPDLKELVSKRTTATGVAIYIGKPITIKNSSCLTCHSTPDKAPPEMIKTYGSANGFGWKLDETIGAQIVSVPTELPNAIADQAFKRIAVWLIGIFVGVFILANLTLALVRRSAAPPA